MFDRPRTGLLTAALCSVLAAGCDETTTDTKPAREEISRPVLPAPESGPRLTSKSAAPAVSQSASASAPPARPSPPAEPPAPTPKGKVPTQLLSEHPGKKRANDPRAFAGPLKPNDDVPWLRRLSLARIARFRRNKGGSTITIKAYYADGYKAAFKPEQRRSVSNYRAEIAAYHLDRLLGLGRVAPVLGRWVDRELLRAHLAFNEAEPEWLERFDAEVEDHDGKVRGAFIAWHSKRLHSESPPAGWNRQLRSRQPVAKNIAGRLGEWSDMIVFDFLLDNYDRWSGGNVLYLGKGGPLILLDNAAGFTVWRTRQGVTTAKRLDPVCRFNRSTIETVRRMSKSAPIKKRLGARLGRSTGRDPLAPILTEEQLEGLDARVEQLLKHVGACEAELGDAVYRW